MVSSSDILNARILVVSVEFMGSLHFLLNRMSNMNDPRSSRRESALISFQK